MTDDPGTQDQGPADAVPGDDPGVSTGAGGESDPTPETSTEDTAAPGEGGPDPEPEPRTDDQGEPAGIAHDETLSVGGPRGPGPDADVADETADQDQGNG